MEGGRRGRAMRMWLISRMRCGVCERACHVSGSSTWMKRWATGSYRRRVSVCLSLFIRAITQRVFSLRLNTISMEGFYFTVQVAEKDVHALSSASRGRFVFGGALAGLGNLSPWQLKQIRSYHLCVSIREGVARHTHTHIQTWAGKHYPAWWRDVLMNNRSHVGMKPVLSLCQSSGLMACWVLACWPVMWLEEYILRKKLF